MKKYTLTFILSLFIIIYSIFIKLKDKKKTKQKSCKDLIYYYKEKHSCIKSYCTKEKIVEQCKKELIKWYEKRTNQKFDLENPKTFNDKIQWMKIYDSTPLKTKLTNKYLVREWVKEKIGEKYLVKLLGVWDSFNDINFDLLPNKFILKANHGCAMNIVVKNKSNLNISDARKEFNNWMNKNFAFHTYEFQYLNIKPKIIAEENIYKIKIMNYMIIKCSVLMVKQIVLVFFQIELIIKQNLLFMI